MYIICEKSYIDRLGDKVDDQTNIGDSDSVNGILKILETKRKLNLSKRAIYKSIKDKTPIYGKYYIYKIKSERD